MNIDLEIYAEWYSYVIGKIINMVVSRNVRELLSQMMNGNS